MKLTPETLEELKQEVEQLTRRKEDLERGNANLGLYLQTIQSLDRDQEKLLYRATFIKLVSDCDRERFAEILQEALTEDVARGKVRRAN